MGNNDAHSPLAMHFGKPRMAAEPTPWAGSRRRRLWDLEHQCHCTVGAVAQSVGRTLMSERMQAELEKRHARG
jgi:hypothetical protein